MATYIQHPALMGAQMADEMSRQRMNAIAQAQYSQADALNKAAAELQKNQMEALALNAKLAAGQMLDASGKPIAFGSDQYKAYLDSLKNMEMQNRINLARMYGVNLDVKPGEPGFYSAITNVPVAAPAMMQSSWVPEGQRWTEKQRAVIGKGTMPEEDAKLLLYKNVGK